MVEAFSVAAGAVIPYLIYLALGFLLKQGKILDEAFASRLNQVIFQAFYPVTMFYNTHAISLDLGNCGKLMAVAAALLLGVIGLSLAIVPRLVKENPRRGVIVQSLYRSNIVLYAMGLAESLFGRAGAQGASVLIAVFVPVYNVTAIAVLEHYRGGKLGFSLVGKVLRNPLFLGAVAGIVFSLLPVTLPSPVENTVAALSGVTTPLALIVLGATLKLSSVRKNLLCITGTLAVKMVVIPAVSLAAAKLAGFGPLDTFLCFIVFATPIAVNAYTMAENMGGDGQLAGELVAASTILSLFTLFGWIALLRGMTVI